MNLKKLQAIRKTICSGCHSYMNMSEYDFCHIPHKVNGEPCPCSICLIKTVCDKPCKKLLNYSRLTTERKTKLIKRKY